MPIHCTQRPISISRWITVHPTRNSNIQISKQGQTPGFGTVDSLHRLGRFGQIIPRGQPKESLINIAVPMLVQISPIYVVLLQCIECVTIVVHERDLMLNHVLMHRLHQYEAWNELCDMVLNSDSSYGIAPTK